MSSQNHNLIKSIHNNKHLTWNSNAT